MASRALPNNVSLSKHAAKSVNVVPAEASRAGHTFEIHADYAIWDTVANDFVKPELFLNFHRH